jgi:hypothetical protein
VFEVKARIRAPSVVGYFKGTFSLYYGIHLLAKELVLEGEVVDGESLTLISDMMSVKDTF